MLKGVPFKVTKLLASSKEIVHIKEKMPFFRNFRQKNNPMTFAFSEWQSVKKHSYLKKSWLLLSII